MARGKNPILQGLSGALGKQIIIKQYGDKTVITAFPSKRKKKPSALQRLGQTEFKAAVAYAQAILKDPVKKKAYEKKVRNGQKVYHYAISEYKLKVKGQNQKSMQ
jgi:hypothetical protein